jgi:deoxyribonuclease-1
MNLNKDVVLKRILVLLVMMAISMTLSARVNFNVNLDDELDHGTLSNGSLVGYINRVARRNYKPLGYKRHAKNTLFRTVSLRQDSEGYYIKDVYCNYLVRGVGPKKSPKNNIMNVEHTWPQSKGSKREPFRGDLHHLYPSDSRANSARGNIPFGEVSNPQDVNNTCTASQRGRILNPKTGKASQQRGFQPPEEHRGNVARALFYGAAAYNYKIGNLEEYYLKKWNKEDPVDQEEMDRNDAIEKAQGNRNPFIDYPNVVDRIQDL